VFIPSKQTLLRTRTVEILIQTAQDAQIFDAWGFRIRRKLAAEQYIRHWRLACRTTSVNVSPVIPTTAPAQPAARKTPSSGSDDQSKNFYNMLRLSAQGTAEGSPNVSIAEGAAKTDKSGKQSNKKADTEQATVNLIAPPAPLQTNGPAPPLSIAALLGLPTHPNADATETGKSETDDGQIAIAPSNTGPYQQSAANTDIAASRVVPQQMVNPDSSDNALPALIKAEPSTPDESAIEQSQLSQKADSVSAAVPQQPEAVSSDESRKPDVPQADHNASALAIIASAALPDVAAPTQQPSKTIAPASRFNSSEENSKLDSPSKDRTVSLTAGVNPIAQLSVALPQQPPETATSQGNGQPNSPGLASAATANQSSDQNNIDPATAGAAPSATASDSPAGHLAFALRLSENPPGSELQPPQAQASVPAEFMIHATAPSGSAALTAAIGASVEAQEKEQPHQHDSSAGTPLYEVPAARPQSVSDAPQANSPDQPAHATAASFDPKHEAASSEPVRNVHMQVVGEDNSRVDVRLIDHGGELHVSVKSGDTNLAQNLQDHMPELTSRLEQQRFQTEVWIPKSAENAKPEMSGARDFSSNGNNGSNNSNSSNQQGKKQQQYQPDWVDVLENSTRGTGKIDQTWLQ
jgi:hypothetical protein